MTLKRFFHGTMAAMMLVTALSPLATVHAESEATSPIDLWGQLIELSSTDVPTTIVVRQNPAGEFTDYTVDIDASTKFGTTRLNTTAMTDWITGDSLHVIGSRNENTGVVTATTIVNASLTPGAFKGLNGWITAIDTDESTMTVQWEGTDHVVNVTADTHMVIPPINPAALSDFQVGDRVRIRLTAGTDNARIIVALRRGDEIFLKARTRPFSAQLEDINDNGDGTGELTVTLTANPHLREGDVNNLIGNEGDELTVTYDSDTKFVRRFNGDAEVTELFEGDQLFIVGRVNDDGTVSARLVKDVQIWQKGVARHAGMVTAIDTDENVITVVPARSEDDSVTGITVEYDGDTSFIMDGDAASESDVNAGDVIHVRGTAHADGGILTVVDVETIVIMTGEDSNDSSDDENEDSDVQADLMVSSIELGSSDAIEITLENAGDADVDSNAFSIYIWLDDELSWTYSASTLADQDFLNHGESSVLSPQTVDEDTEVKVCVDYGEDIDESNEDNNCKTVTLDVSGDNGGEADLTVSDIFLDGSTVEFTVENTGDADVDESVLIYAWIGDDLGWWTYSSVLEDQDFLEAGGSSTLTTSLTLDEDTEVKVCVDHGEDADESDEDNNCLTETLSVE